MAKVEKAKGNPAHTRMANEHRKLHRQRCWRNSQRRKELRTALQHTQEIANRALRKAGELTPWERACAERAARRVSAGLAELWEKSRKAEQLPAA